MSARKIRCITRVQGGLGNQLFCYAHGRAIAQRLGAELVLDISEVESGDAYGRRYVLRELGILDPTRSWSFLAGRRSRAARTLLRLVFRNRVYREPRSPIAAVGNVPWVYLDGYWQAETAELVARRVELQAAVRVAPDSLSDPVRGLGARLRGESAIGIHVRSYAEEIVPARRGTPRPGYFIAALEMLFEEFGPRPIFVAADRQAPVLPERLQKWVVAAPQRSQYEDLQLLRDCAFHVLCNSSFGWWGAFLSNSVCTYYPVRAGYFHYPQPVPDWRLLADP